jgi:hypothetical protein
VVEGKARFTVLTPQLLRMEYDESATFEDRATLAFVNRRLPVPKYNVTRKDGTLTIETSAIKLIYSAGRPFETQTLSVAASTKATAAGSKLKRWTPGASNSGNLLGTIRSLDKLGPTPLNCTTNRDVVVHNETLHCEWGLTSRDGWALVDDTTNWALTPGAEWWDSPNRDNADWYLFAHGHEYAKAVSDYTRVGGRAPLIPRYALGVWFTQWYDFNNAATKALVSKFQERSLPLDVYVTDMNWHQKDAWGGWTFDTNLYPYPTETFGWLHWQGLTVAANVHDADGVGSSDKMLEPMREAMGLDPTEKSSVPFSITNKSYAYALEDIVLGDVAHEIDFIWSDYQQGEAKGGAVGGKQNPTMMLNKLRVTDPKRQRGAKDTTRKRGMTLSRWGGLGSHRYPVGFSGDVGNLTESKQLTWANLAYQVRLAPTTPLRARTTCPGRSTHAPPCPVVTALLFSHRRQRGLRLLVSRH